MARGRLRIALLIAVTATLSALEISGTPPAFLATTLTPKWRLTPISAVFDELGRDTKVTITRTDGVIALAEQPVLLVSTQAMTCQAVLEELERCADVRFTVANDGLRVERLAEYIQRRREVRWYSMTEYGLLAPVRDAVAPPMGFTSRRLDGIGIDLGGAAPTAAAAYDPEMIVEYLRMWVSPSSWEMEGVGIEQRGGENLVVYQTPENQARIREVLARLRDREGGSKRWLITFGLLAKDEQLATGIVKCAVAHGVGSRLTKATTLTLAGLLGQQVQTAERIEQSHIVSVDVVNHQFDPKTIAVARGRSATLRAVNGQQGTLVDIQLAWIEDAEKPNLSVIRSSPHALPVTTTTRTTNGEQTATTGAASTAGEQIPLQQPVLWAWQPALEMLLPLGHALILSSEHPSGRAVMVLEELP